MLSLGRSYRNIVNISAAEAISGTLSTITVDKSVDGSPVARFRQQKFE
jgi:hypothetical protein